MMNRLAIMGIGLMGGSLGLAARRCGLARTVAGFARREAVREAALEKGIVDEVHAAPGDAAADADLVVFCLPVLAIPECAEVCRPHLKPGCVATDVGSTKRELVFRMEQVLRDSGATFVGSHPIAGSDATGLEAACADLYDDAVVVVTPAADPEALDVVEEFWGRLGSRVVRMHAEEHDRVIARTSHLPHLVAAALVDTVCREGGAFRRDLCGSGFRDTTRIAGGSESVWHDILRSNRDAVRAELGCFAEVLARVERMLDEDDFEGLRTFLGRCREWRSEFD